MVRKEKGHNSLFSCFFFLDDSLFPAVGQWGRSRKVAGDEQCLRSTALSFSLPDSARHPIVTTHQVPETGHLDIKACLKRLVRFRT